MNILYIDNGGVISDTHMYQYYGDLYRELRELENVHVYEGDIHNINQFLNLKDFKFDGIVFGLGYFARTDTLAYQKINGLSDISIPTVCMLHKPQTMLEEKLNFCKINKIDLLLDSQCTYKKHGEIANTRSIRSWFTATPKIYHPRDVEKKYDIGFCGALHGDGKIIGPTRNLRSRIKQLLDLSSSEYRIFWNSSNTLDYRIQSTEEYATKINECEIWLATTGPTEDVSPRYFEVMLSKTLLFCNDMPEQYGGLFKDGVNCVTCKNDLSNFEEKLNYYLENSAKRNSIISNAYNMTINQYTWKHMALNLLNKIEEIKNDK